MKNWRWRCDKCGQEFSGEGAKAPHECPASTMTGFGGTLRCDGDLFYKTGEG